MSRYPRGPTGRGTKTPIAHMPRDRPPETLRDVRQQRDATNRLLMELAECTKQALALLRDYVRVYPNNSGRTSRFLARMERDYGFEDSRRSGPGKG